MFFESLKILFEQIYTTGNVKTGSEFMSENEEFL
jgi:hypothetical protein